VVAPLSLYRFDLAM